MVLDRRTAHEIVQALMPASNKKDEGNILETVTHTSTACGDGSYGGPVFGGMGFPSASQPGATIGNKAASQSRKLTPTPRPHPFRDLARLSDPGEVADLVQARGASTQDQLAFNEAPSNSSRQANPQTTYGRPLAVNAGARTQQGY